MARLITIEPNKTYATEANAIRAVEKKAAVLGDARYFIHRTPEGRFFPVFIGVEALNVGAHWLFNVVA
jgi:hypothetical protein